jgi:HEAT repeat protein
MKLEERLEQLRLLRSSAAADAEGPLRKALKDRSNLIVAEAAKTIAVLSVRSLIPEMLGNFDRLFVDPVKADPKCWGKIAIARALIELGYDQSPPFVRGSRHVQMEPVWGGHEDAAPSLRATCLLALVQCTDLRRVEVLRRLVDATADGEDPVRIEAVRAIAQMGGDDGALLLRLKARMGDKRPLIVGHAFDALLSLEKDLALEFVVEYLDSPDVEIRDEAALALGSSRLPKTVGVLIDKWNATREPEFRGTLLRALSSSRDEGAIEFLLAVVRTGSGREASSALEALKLHEASPEIQAMVERAKADR